MFKIPFDDLDFGSTVPVRKGYLNICTLQK